MRRPAFLALGIALGLSACAITKPPSVEDSQAANEPLYCTAGEQCSDYWKRAQVFLVQNGRYRLQLVTDSVLTTYGPVRSELWFAYQVTKRPLGDGREQIEVAVGCGNMFGCVTHPDTAVANFKRAIRR